MTEKTKYESPDVSELVIFRMAKQEFCIDIRSVREIRGFSAATPLPHAPGFVTGVINLRGTVLPILDLSLRFGFGRTEPTARSVVIVCNCDRQLVGLLVDAVSDIMTVGDEHMQPAPDFASEVVTKFVKGVIAIENRLISVIGVNGLLPSGEPVTLAA